MMVDLRDAILDPAIFSRRSPSLSDGELRPAASHRSTGVVRARQTAQHAPSLINRDRDVARDMSVHMAIPLLDSQPLNNT
jgi:hypothetical protein